MGKVTWLGVLFVIVLLVVAAVLCIKYIPGAHEWVTDLFSPAEQTTEQEENTNNEQSNTGEKATDIQTTLYKLNLTKGEIVYEFSR